MQTELATPSLAVTAGLTVNGLADTANKLRQACKGEKIREGPTAHGATAPNTPSQARQSVKAWLNKLEY